MKPEQASKVKLWTPTAHLYADIRTAVETGRRRDMRAIDAIRLTMQGLPLPVPG